MSLAALARATLGRIPAAHRLAATLRQPSTGLTTTGTVLEGVLAPERRALASGETTHQAERELALLAAGLAFPPATGMELVVAATTWVIRDVEVVEPTDGGAPILYRLVVLR